MTNKSLKILSPQPTLAAAGTAQKITASTKEVRSVVLYASDSNSGKVYIGDSDANAKAGTGINLSAGESIEITGDELNGTPEMIDISSIYFDGANTGDKLVVMYLE